MIWLACRSMSNRRDWRRDGKSRIKQVSVLEGVERNELCELTTENLGRTSKVVNQNLACLLVLGEIRALVKSSTTRAIHVELWWTVQLDNERAHLLRRALGSSVHISLYKVDILDPSEGVFNLVSSRVVVDVVGDAGLLWRVKDDEIHLRLSDSSPRANRKGTAVEVLNDCLVSETSPSRHGMTVYLPTLPVEASVLRLMVPLL